MTTYVGLLRAVNVAGHNRVGVSELRDLVADLGMTDVRSLLTSGNLVFTSSVKSAGRLESQLESGARRYLGPTTDFLVRRASEWSRIVGDNPFAEEARRDPSHLVVMLLKSAPEAEGVAALRSVIRGRETIQVNGRQAYVVYPDGIARSRLTSRLIEEKLGVRGTGRNWNTMLKLAAMTRESQDESPSGQSVS